MLERTDRMVMWVLLGALALAQPAPQTDPARTGWDALQRRDGEAAAAAFHAALRANPSDVRALVGAGLAEHLLGRDVQAAALLKRAVEIEPRDAEASEALGRIAYAQGDLPLAIASYQRLLALTPADPAAAARLAAWKKEAALHDTLIAQPTGRFTVMFEGETQQAIATRVSEILEAAYYRIGRALNAFAPNPVTAILYTGEQFKDITQSPSWAAGAYDGRIRIPVGGALDTPADLERVVTHELVHAILHQVYPRVPKWINEGLATYFEPGEHRGLIGKLRADGRIPLARLDAAFETPDAAQAAVAYAQAFAGARLLAERLGPVLPVFLEYLNAGTPLEETLGLFNVALADLEQVWTRRDHD
jgi:tetratricopeptide (TPR) repeat protein